MGGSISYGRVTRVLALVLAIAAGYAIEPDFFEDIANLMRFSDVTYSMQVVQSYGQYAKLAMFAFIVVINILAVLPNIFVLAAAGALFGVVEGFVIAWLAETVGVSISFLLMRYLFRASADQFIKRHGTLNQLNEFSGKDGFRFILLARCVPYVPSGVITAMAALSRVGFREHFFATLIGKLPSAWVEVTVGHDLLSFRAHLLRITFLLGTSVLAYRLFYRNNRKPQ